MIPFNIGNGSSRRHDAHEETQRTSLGKDFRVFRDFVIHRRCD